MKNQNNLKQLMYKARRGLTLAALMVFAATAGATFMGDGRAEADPGGPQQLAPDQTGVDAPSRTEFRPRTNPAPAQAYKAADEPPLTKNGKVITGKLNINTATEDELRMLPGIGPAKASRVLDYRKRHGNFKRVRDLRRVKGFGYKTVQKLSPYLTVDGKTTLRAE